MVEPLSTGREDELEKNAGGAAIYDRLLEPVRGRASPTGGVAVPLGIGCGSSALAVRSLRCEP